MNYTISDLIIYPIKSLGGIHLQQSFLEEEGLQYDRRWMLVDEQGNFLTQRQHPKMCLFQVQFTEGGLLVTQSEQSSSFFFPFNQSTEKELTVSIWEDNVKATFVSDLADKWFSTMMDMPCKLVSIASDAQRKVDTRYAFRNETTRFSDAFPVLIIGESSLEDVNKRIDSPVPMNRFRPNIVFKGGNAFEEDSWKNIQVGSSALKVVKPCARCVITTIDQQTAQAGKDPLKTLASYRTVDNKVLFGQNSLVINPGTIRLGDEIKIVSNL